MNDIGLERVDPPDDAVLCRQAKANFLIERARHSGEETRFDHFDFMAELPQPGDRRLPGADDAVDLRLPSIRGEENSQALFPSMKEGR